MQADFTISDVGVVHAGIIGNCTYSVLENRYDARDVDILFMFCRLGLKTVVLLVLHMICHSYFLNHSLNNVVH